MSPEVLMMSDSPRPVREDGVMSKRELANLVEVKKTLAEKYEHLASISNSKPKARSYRTRAKHHRNQATSLQRKLAAKG